MYCDVPEAAYYLNYQSPASLYRLIKAGLLEDYVEEKISEQLFTKFPTILSGELLKFPKLLG